jgi:hypothetical protein
VNRRKLLKTGMAASGAWLIPSFACAAAPSATATIFERYVSSVLPVNPAQIERRPPAHA